MPSKPVTDLGTVWALEYLRIYGIPPGEAMAEPFIFLPSVQAALPMPARDFCDATDVALRYIEQQRQKAPPLPAPGPLPTQAKVAKLARKGRK